LNASLFLNNRIGGDKSDKYFYFFIYNTTGTKALFFLFWRQENKWPRVNITQHTYKIRITKAVHATHGRPAQLRRKNNKTRTGIEITSGIHGKRSGQVAVQEMMNRTR